MDSIQKLYSDIEKIKKHNRNSSGTLDLNKVATQVSEMFQRNNRDFCDLPNSLAEYWVKTYVYPQIDLNANDLSQESVDKLCAMQAFLDNDIEDDTDCLTLDDWKQIAAFVNFEAEDMPIDLLSQMMSILVEKRAL